MMEDLLIRSKGTYCRGIAIGEDGRKEMEGRERKEMKGNERKRRY